MAKERGWWELTYTTEPSETDVEHVAALVRDGYSGGQLLGDAGPGQWGISFNVEPTEYDLEYVADWIAGGSTSGEMVKDY